MLDRAPVDNLIAAVSNALRRDASASRPAPVARAVPRVGPDRDIDIRLPDGRRLRARISPAVARRKDLSAIARVGAENDRRAFHALRRQRQAIRQLRQSQAALAKQLTALEQQSERVVAGVIQGLSGLDRRARDLAAQSPVARQLRRQQVRQLRETKRLAVRAQIQNATAVVNSVQAAAFGEKGSPFAPNNLRLAANQLFWALLDPVLQRAGVLNASSATVVAALAPLGTLLSGQILLGNRQHVRIISGVTELNAPGVTSESLRGRIAEGLWPEFRRRTDVLVTAKIVDPAAFGTLPVQARVDQGNLELEVPPLGRPLDGGLVLVSVPPPRVERVRVAWTVDTGADVG